MPTHLSVAQRNAHANLAAQAVDAGTGPGYVEVYSGAQPATVATAPTGTLLAVITVNDPAFGAPVNGTAAADVDPAPASTWLADYSGAGWFRVYTSDGTAVRDGALAAVVAVTDDPVEIASWTVTMPESGS